MQHHVVSIIDDDASVREGATDLLNSAGIITESFQNAHEFLRSGCLDSTSCVVADVRMPGMSGIELHEQMRLAGKAVPTILITAFPRDSDRMRARDSGVWAYLRKPFREEELLTHVNSALQGGPQTVSAYWDETTRSNVDEQPAIASTFQDETIRIEELSGPDALEAITPEWEALDGQLSPRTPFTSPLWAKLWWHHLRQTKPAIRQEFFVHTMRDSKGKLLAIVPLMVTYRPGIGPLQLRLLQLFGGADGSISEHRCIICREHDEARVIRALTNYLKDHKERWDLFVWTGIRRNAFAYDPREQLRVYKKTPYYLVPLPTSWDEFRSGLSPNMKEAIRKCYRYLARDGHTFIFRAVTELAEIPNSLNRLLELHADRAQLKYAPMHRDLFAKASRRAFIAELAQRMAEQNRLCIFELEVAGKVVASRMAFLLRDELYLYYSGYDLEWRKHSIMTTLMCECFKWAIENGIATVNLSKGKDPSKLRWRGREVEFDDALLISPTRRGALVSGAYKLLSSRPGLFARLTELLTLVWAADLTQQAAISFG
jgi:FixJ family two-component response regulator/CelD/BcsL family acetyltransferase involved in cellulose biosynthesis